MHNLVKIEQTYITPTETHNPIEMSGTIAAWECDKKLTLYDATQFVKGVQNILARSLRTRSGKRARHLSIRRRRVWLQRRGLDARPAGRDGARRSQAFR